jgi:hypothetical protein
MSYRPAYNVLDRPVVVDDEGRTLGGGEWGVVESTSDAGRGALARGDVVLVDDDLDTEGTNRDALAAVEQARTLRERAEQFGALDKDRLEEFARDEGLLEDDERGRKRDLVTALARRSHVDPTATPAELTAPARDVAPPADDADTTPATTGRGRRRTTPSEEG